MDASVFRGWDSFYVIIGSAAAGLIGLLFIVVTLTSRFDRKLVMRAIAIYTTPTAVHFALILTTCAVAMAPRLPIAATAAIFGVCALVGLVTAVQSCLGIRQGIPGGEPLHWSDFWMYGVVPGALYVGLACSALGPLMHADWALLTTAGVLLALLLAAIRNAWDLVTFMAPRAKEGAD
jgi:hypothetical protein